MIIFTLVFMIGFDIVESDPCTNYSALPYADLRFVNNVYDMADDAVNDRYLTPGWYRAGDEDMPVTMPNSTSCGTNSPIWLNGTIPRNSSIAFSRKACVVVGGLGCIKEYNIKVKSCGTYRVYYLLPTSASDEGYCFGTGDPGQKPSYTPPKAEVEVGIISHNGLKAFSAVCKFEKSTGSIELFYQVTWYIDGVYLTSMKPELFSDLSHIVLDETNLKNLGRNVYCSVRARKTPKEPPGLSVKSAGIFFGIEILTPDVHIERGSHGTIRLRPTVPIGCLPDGDSCLLRVVMYTKRTDDCHHITTFGQTTCGAMIMTRDWYNVIEISVAVDEEDGHDTLDDMVYVDLRTDEYFFHSIWSRYALPLIKVSVGHITGLDTGACQAKNGGIHMLTFDQRPYYVQYGGDFIMYNHTQYPIQVQARLRSCNNNGGAPFCVLGVAVQAGRDVFVIDKTRHYADYSACIDSTLDVRMVNTLNYQIYTPIGSRVDVVIGRNHIAVHIYPSMRDKGKTEGLCGTLTNDCTDDFKMSDAVWFENSDTRKTCDRLGTTDYLLKPKPFSDSWLVSHIAGAVNLFDPSLDVNALLAWKSSDRRCKCHRIFGKQNNEIDCSASMVSTCPRNKRTTSRVNTCKLHRIPSKRSRKANQTEREWYHQRKKKSAPSTVIQMTEPEAEAYCQSTLGNSKLFKLCGDVPNVNTEHSIQTCVMDIMISNTTDWTDSTREALQDRCLSELELNTTLEKNGTVRQPSIAAAIREIACPANCSDSGRCVNGTCDCQDGFGGPDCSIDLSVPPYFEELLDDGMCDKQGWECNVAMATGDDFLAQGHLKCKMEPFWYDTHGKVYVEKDEIVTADIQTFMTLFCPLPMTRRKRDTSGKRDNNNTFVEGYHVSLSNDGIHFGDVHTLFIYDSHCQTPSLSRGKQAFRLKDGYCFIDNKCTDKNAINQANVDQMCNPTVSSWVWSTLTT